MSALPSSTPRTLAMPAPGSTWTGRPGNGLFPHVLELAAERDPRAALRAGHHFQVVGRSRDGGRHRQAENQPQAERFDRNSHGVSSSRRGRFIGPGFFQVPRVAVCPSRERYAAVVPSHKAMGGKDAPRARPRPAANNTVRARTLLTIAPHREYVRLLICRPKHENNTVSTQGILTPPCQRPPAQTLQDTTLMTTDDFNAKVARVRERFASTLPGKIADSFAALEKMARRRRCNRNRHHHTPPAARDVRHRADARLRGHRQSRPAD